MITLERSIETLYTIFGKYTTEGIHYCDCGCIKEEDVLKLNSRPLRELKKGDLISYHGSALYTWGDAEHYKHYLPRIAELCSQRDFSFVDIGEIYIKLAHANWLTWPLDEQQAIRDFVLAHWVNFIHDKPSEIRDTDLEQYGKFFSMNELVRLWDISGSAHALRNFVFFFYHHGNAILQGGLKVDGVKHDDEFRVLLRKNDLVHKLEAGFYEAETSDPEYAGMISTVLMMVEQGFKNS